jgi:hypothetical protein
MRVDGWEGRLQRVLEAARTAPYVLGHHDCFRVACAAVEALTGINRWPEFSGRYRTKAEARRLMASYGRSFDEVFGRIFDCEGVDPKLARNGDVVKYTDPEGEAHLGVCVGSHVAVLGESGLLFVPREDCGPCWRVG